MQDGFIFSDTIERNIATGEEKIDREKLKNAARVANIENYIESLADDSDSDVDDKEYCEIGKLFYETANNFV